MSSSAVAIINRASARSKPWLTTPGVGYDHAVLPLGKMVGDLIPQYSRAVGLKKVDRPERQIVLLAAFDFFSDLLEARRVHSWNAFHYWANPLVAGPCFGVG